MKYCPPIGKEAGGEAAVYVDGNPEAGIEGSAVAAKAIEPGMRELIHLIRFAGLTPSDNDLQQVRKAIAILIESAAPGIATVSKNGVARPDGTTITVDVTGKLTVFGAKYITAGDCDLLSAGTYICDNTAGKIAHAPPGMAVFFYEKRSIPTSASTFLVYDQAESFGGVYRKAHRNYVPENGAWSGWADTPYLPAYTKVYRATDAVDGRLALQAAVGYNNVSLWPSGGKLMISRNDGDTTAEIASMALDPTAGTINGVLPAPRPTSANFVGCGSTLPAGGTWAYCISCWNSTGYYIQTYSGVAAGGTVVASGSSFYSGFAWRVA